MKNILFSVLSISLLVATPLLAAAPKDNTTAAELEGALRGSVASAVTLSESIDARDPSVRTDVQRVKTMNTVNLPKLNAELARIDADRPAIEAQIEALCPIEVPQAELAAATARCRAVKDPWHRRIDNYNTKKEAFNTEKDGIRDRLQHYSDDKDELAKQKQAIQRQARVLALAMRADCALRCNSGALEAVVDCQERCWDGARLHVQAILKPLGMSISPNI